MSSIIKFRPTSDRIPEYRRFNSEKVGIFLDGIVGSSDPEVLVDQVSDLSSAKETVLFLGFSLLQTDASLK